MSPKIQLMQGDCLELMKDIPDGSVDLILCDLPYGTTQAKWDVVIPFEPLWGAYWRIAKPNAAVVLFGSEPFSSKLRLSNIENFRYDWIWLKSRTTGFLDAKKRPLKSHEIVSVFFEKQPIYNVELKRLEKPIASFRKNGKTGSLLGQTKDMAGRLQTETGYPISVIHFPNEHNVGTDKHPTQKPVALLEYLIRTYTNEGDLVLDNCMGSGSTGVACKNLNRNFIGIEKDENYFNIAQKRILSNEP